MSVSGLRAWLVDLTMGQLRSRVSRSGFGVMYFVALLSAEEKYDVLPGNLNETRDPNHGHSFVGKSMKLTSIYMALKKLTRAGESLQPCK